MRKKRHLPIIAQPASRDCDLVTLEALHPSDSTTLPLTEHSDVLLKCAQQLLELCKYVDVALTVQGQQIYCHRLVLVSYRCVPFYQCIENTMLIID